VDLACRLGANSLFLADHHYAVKAFDISEVAVNHVNRLALKEHATVHANVCDLSQWGNLDLKENSIDFLVTTYYLDRTIFPYVKSIIKEGGYFFMETFYLSRSHTNENVSNQYKLQPNELLTEFKDWHVLFYEENEQEGRQTIFAKKNVESR
jgi:tellurite methyltransferase